MPAPRSLFAALVGVALLAPIHHSPAADTSISGPQIATIRGRTVTVAVPDGYDSVTLQTLRPKRGARTRPFTVWATLDTQFPRGTARTLTFRLSTLTPRRNLRVFGTASSPLPEHFLAGATSFGSDLLTLSTNSSTSSIAFSTGGRGLDDVTANGPLSSGANVGAPGTPPTSAVVESDIWKIDGNRLYFFNQLRGLQVLDLTNPDAPALVGTLRMPASGEDLYLLDHQHVAVLKQSPSLYFAGGPIFIDSPVAALSTTDPRGNGSTLSLAAATPSGLATTLRPFSEASRENELVIADVSGGAPAQVASLTFKGALIESRLVGRVLYVATSTTGTAPGSTTDVYGTRVTAYDLSDPTNPLEGGSLFFPTWTSVVTATPDYFFVVSNSGSGSTVQLVDISAGDGTLKAAGSVSFDGYVADKFKLSAENGVLTVLAQVWPRWAYNQDGEWSLVGQAGTALQTFSLADAAAPQPLGRLLIAPGESLRATRFDTGRVYVVTFEQIDPLHIVDLSDPANPVISGEVNAPGFSTYIQPLGDRLVTIGLVNWQPAVSLFEVSDPASPRLLQQLKLGGKNDGWASSEAVWNEKAFKVLPDQNLILLPISGVDLATTDQWGGEWFARVQLIDLFRDSLAKRGVIDRNFSPRRADVVNERIVAISPSKLVTVNATNRDKPKVTSEVQLAWSVDRIFHRGDYVVEIGGPGEWTGEPAPTLSVSPANDPDNAIAVEDLAPLDVVGSALRDEVLYLAQRAWPRWWVNTAAEEKSQLLVTAYDLSALPKLKKLSQASGPAPIDYWRELTPLWPSPGTLVWSANGRYAAFDSNVRAVDPLQTTSSISGGLIRFYPWGTWSKQLVAFDVATPERIAYASTFELKPTPGCSLSEPVAAPGLILASEQRWWTAPTAASAAPAEAGRHFLRAVEYTEPAAPYLREERVNIPGRLIGTARAGKLLYTVGSDLNLADGSAKNTAALHASAFDGIESHLVATLPIAAITSPIRFSGSNICVLEEQPAYVWQNPPIKISDVNASLLRPISGSYAENPLNGDLRVATLTDAGEFTELGTLEVAHDVGLFLFNDLAVTQPNTRAVRAIDLSNPLAPIDVGTYATPGFGTLQLDHGDGSVADGLWIPAGPYGVETISFAK